MQLFKIFSPLSLSCPLMECLVVWKPGRFHSLETVALWGFFFCGGDLHSFSLLESFVFNSFTALISTELNKSRLELFEY